MALVKVASRKNGRCKVGSRHHKGRKGCYKANKR